MANKKALVTGINGQDGSYIADLLLEKGYEIYGMVRDLSAGNFERINHIKDKVELINGDLTDQSSLDNVIKTVGPDEVYNFAAQSFIPTSWSEPILTGETTALGANRMLEAIRKIKPEARFYQASSSEIFGKARETPQNELTPFYPRSPYGVAKLYAHFITVNYREKYDLFACSGILFNHESPRRGAELVTRKITSGVARIKLGLTDELRLGNLDARRDWGYAGDYVEAMWLMLQQDTPGDYVVATGHTHSVRDFVEVAFERVGLDYEKYVVIDERFVRPVEKELLVGDPTKAKKELGWEPRVSFNDLIKMMVDHDMELAKEEKALKDTSNDLSKRG